MLARYNRKMKKIQADSRADSIQYGSAVMNQNAVTDMPKSATKTDAEMEQENIEAYLLSAMKKKGDNRDF